MTTYYRKDTMTGRITKRADAAAPDLDAMHARLARHSAQLAIINHRALRLATEAGFTREEYLVAQTRTVNVWRNRALDSLLSAGDSFDDFIIQYVRPVR